MKSLNSKHLRVIANFAKQCDRMTSRTSVESPHFHCDQNGMEFEWTEKVNNIDIDDEYILFHAQIYPTAGGKAMKLYVGTETVQTGVIYAEGRELELKISSGGAPGGFIKIWALLISKVRLETVRAIRRELEEQS